jgi:hypothetical protein
MEDALCALPVVTMYPSDLLIDGMHSSKHFASFDVHRFDVPIDPSPPHQIIDTRVLIRTVVYHLTHGCRPISAGASL